MKLDEAGKYLIIPMDDPCIFVQHLGFSGSTWHKSSEIVTVVEAIGLLKHRNNLLREKNDWMRRKLSRAQAEIILLGGTLVGQE